MGASRGKGRWSKHDRIRIRLGLHLKFYTKVAPEVYIDTQEFSESLLEVMSLLQYFLLVGPQGTIIGPLFFILFINDM